MAKIDRDQPGSARFRRNSGEDYAPANHGLHGENQLVIGSNTMDPLHSIGIPAAEPGKF